MIDRKIAERIVEHVRRDLLEAGKSEEGRKALQDQTSGKLLFDCWREAGNQDRLVAYLFRQYFGGTPDMPTVYAFDIESLAQKMSDVIRLAWFEGFCHGREVSASEFTSTIDDYLKDQMKGESE